MDDRIKIVYSWIGPKGPAWNTELPNVFSLNNISEHGTVNSTCFVTDSVWHQIFSHDPESYDMYPACSITTEDERPFIIPYTLFWRINFSFYFTGKTGLLEFAHVPWHLIRLVRDKNGYILIDHGVEAFMSEQHLNSLHDYFGNTHGIPLNKIIYLTGAVNSNKLYSDYCERNGIPNDPHYRLTIIPYASGGYIFKRHLQLPGAEPEYNTETVPEKLFLMWNRRFRDHRIEAALHLEELGLVERSYVSFSKTHIEHPSDTFLDRAIRVVESNRYRNEGINEEVAQRFNNKLPLVLDDEHEITQMCEDTNHKSRPYYQNSLVSVVTETNFGELEVALTEKSFKPFKEKHPFILVAGAGALEYLQSLGFKTFNEFWSEEYDNEDDSPDERMRRIREVFKVISSWDHNQILDFKRRVKPILEHNFNLIKTLGVDMLLDNINKLVRENIK
jgi:hypothetical protein